LTKNDNESYEAKLVFTVDKTGEYSIGIDSHNFMSDYDIVIMDHLHNEILASSGESFDGYIKVNLELVPETPYRVVILGTHHEKNKTGKFYIKEKKGETL
jgi:hypothetical protein